MVEHALRDDGRLVQTKGEDTHASDRQSCNDLLRVPCVSRSTPIETDEQRGEGAGKGQDADVVDRYDEAADAGVLSAKAGGRWMVDDQDEQTIDAVDVGVEVVGPSPCVLFDKETRGQGSCNDGDVGECHDNAFRPGTVFVGGNLEGCGHTDDLEIADLD